jgi:hypothetical protein
MAQKSLLWIWNLKWQSARFAIANGMRQVPIGSNSQNICGVGIVDTIDPHTLILCKRALGGDFCILWPAETECWREVDLIRTYTRWMFNHIRHNSTNLSHNVKQHLNIESKAGTDFNLLFLWLILVARYKIELNESLARCWISRPISY